MDEQKNGQATITRTAFADPLAAAYELTSLIRAHADETERARRLAAPVVDALRSARLFTMGLPTSLGGESSGQERP